MMKKSRFNLFQIIRENESVVDERISKARYIQDSTKFSCLKIGFCILMISQLFPFINKEIGYNILYDVFAFIFWIEPYMFSKKGLWVNVREAKIYISTGCIFSMLIVSKVAQLFISHPNINTIILVFLLMIFAAIGSYIFYTITYKNYIKNENV